MSQKELTYDALAITTADVHRQLGYGNATPDAKTQAVTAAIIAEVRQWLRPRFCYQVEQRLPPTLNPGPVIASQLRNAEAYACFIATSGAEYEAYLQRLKREGDLVRLFIADALGSVVAEACADQMEHHLQQSIDKLHWHHTNRFSPGYCGWSVAQQQQLFPLFKGQTCGVSLTQSSLMVPIKSVSGIIGIGRNVSRKDYACHLCSQENCFKQITN